MTKPASECKPMYAFEERDNRVKFQIIIDGLKVSRHLTKAFAKYPDNATIVDCEFREQSMNYAINFHPSSKTYRFQVKRLPCPIDTSKTKITYDTDKVKIVLFKKVRESWRPYNEFDFETSR